MSETAHLGLPIAIFIIKMLWRLGTWNSGGAYNNRPGVTSHLQGFWPPLLLSVRERKSLAEETA